MLTLRDVTLGDLPLLERWNRNEHVIFGGGDWDWDELDIGRKHEWRELLIAQIDGRPLGFMQILDPAREESNYWGDVEEHLRAIDIWIGEAGDLGKGHGTTMMRLALDRCFAHPAVTAIVIDPRASNVRSHRFYERLGFRFVETRRFREDDEDCRVYRLPRAHYETDSKNQS